MRQHPAAELKIAFLLDNAYGIGGTIRATATLSGAMTAPGHRVEVVSLRRTRDTTELPFAPEVTFTSLIDLRPDTPAYGRLRPPLPPAQRAVRRGERPCRARHRHSSG
ncbi:hypothetical protein ACQPYK_24075 [Streptosporangium sp. CA-135522]|uniref:hypothetical protein n=1 Tax=Streptosporangium sp. CA-135522 TaxID=3240072 RepID=UPI003D9463F6